MVLLEKKYERLSVELKERVLCVTLSNPSRLNALDAIMLDELRALFEGVHRGGDFRCVMIRGAGDKAFAAGADIKGFASLRGAEAEAFARVGQGVFDLVENSPIPVLAAIKGYALGGGCEMAMACHLRVCDERAVFGQPEINLGVIPGYGGTYRLPRFLGATRALEKMLLGDTWTAQQAYDWGLVNYIYPTETLYDDAFALLRRLCDKPAVAVSHLLALYRAHWQTNPTLEAEAFGDCCKTADFREGTDAFLNKRKPQFKGR